MVVHKKANIEIESKTGDKERERQSHTQRGRETHAQGLIEYASNPISLFV